MQIITEKRNGEWKTQNGKWKNKSNVEKGVMKFLILGLCFVPTAHFPLLRARSAAAFPILVTSGSTAHKDWPTC